MKWCLPQHDKVVYCLYPGEEVRRFITGPPGPSGPPGAPGSGVYDFNPHEVAGRVLDLLNGE